MLGKGFVVNAVAEVVEGDAVVVEEDAVAVVDSLSQLLRMVQSVMTTAKAIAAPTSSATRTTINMFLTV